MIFNYNPGPGGRYELELLFLVESIKYIFYDISPLFRKWIRRVGFG
jgi:hypothetical protein